MRTFSLTDTSSDRSSDPPIVVSLVEPTTAREARMLIVMLSACDPCGYVDDAGDPHLYAGIALDVLGRLHRGDDNGGLLAAFPPDVAVEGAVRFAGAAVDWWQTMNGTDSSARGGAADAFLP